MAQSTTMKGARNCEIQVDDGGSLQDVSGSSNVVNLNYELLSGEVYTFDGDWRKVFPGKKKWSGDVNAIYSETATQALDVLWDALHAAAATSISISPDGGDTGDWEWTGEVLFTNVSIPLDGTDANPILCSFTFEGDGELTKGTAA